MAGCRVEQRLHGGKRSRWRVPVWCRRMTQEKVRRAEPAMEQTPRANTTTVANWISGTRRAAGGCSDVQLCVDVSVWVMAVRGTKASWLWHPAPWLSRVLPLVRLYMHRCGHIPPVVLGRHQRLVLISRLLFLMSLLSFPLYCSPQPVAPRASGLQVLLGSSLT